jgi:hypothetical protein
MVKEKEKGWITFAYTNLVLFGSFDHDTASKSLAG